MPHDIFINCARTDRDRIPPLLHSLRAIGVSVWADESMANRIHYVFNLDETLI